MQTSPRLTVVVTQREYFSHSQASLESILAERSIPFSLIYVDAGSPPAVRDYLARKQREAGFLLLRSESWVWPTHSRMKVLDRITTEYVVFIDNDVLVEPGCFKTLVDAADETGAALVGPLYLIARPGAGAMIHMAGGELVRKTLANGHALIEEHVLADAPIGARQQLKRRTCDFVEFHCMLARRDFVAAQGMLDPSIYCVHEHIDLALSAQKRGLSVVLEPSAVVTYFPPKQTFAVDRPFFRWRWDAKAVEESIASFCRKWGVIDTAEAFDGIRKWALGHFQGSDLLSRGRNPAPQSHAWTPEHFPQNLTQHLTLAHQRGYSATELSQFADAFVIAQRVFNGAYRADGRPFLCHLLGTGSALLQFGALPEIVVAGTLHSAYTHCPNLGDTVLDWIEKTVTGRFGATVEALIRSYARLQLEKKGKSGPADLDFQGPSAIEHAALLINLANQVELMMSGEKCVLNHMLGQSAVTPNFLALARLLDAPWLIGALECGSTIRVPVGFTGSQRVSYRIEFDGGNIVPLANDRFTAWDRARVAADASHPQGL